MTDESSGAEPLRRAFPTGVAVIVPAVVTLVVLASAFNAVYDYLDAFSSAVVAVSPAVGSVYQRFRQMSDAMLDSDSGNSREVVPVEFPTEGTHTPAFVTSETPDVVADHADAEGESMRTLFMSMAPNPVMGGHVVFAPERRVVDVELTVDEGIRAPVTSGVALEEVAADLDDVDSEDLRAGAPERTVDARFPADERPDDPEDPRGDDRSDWGGDDRRESEDGDGQRGRGGDDRHGQGDGDR